MVREGHLLAVLGVLLLVGCAGARSEAPRDDEQGRSSEAMASEEDRCGRTRTVHLGAGFGSDDDALTNDVPGCPDGGALSGGDKADKLTGGDGDDEVRGFGGVDELWGGFGRDVMHGGTGDDFLTGSTVNEDGRDRGDDVLRGGPGRDSLNGFGGNDVIYGGDGDDVERLWGGRGEDVLRGGDGDDFLDGTFDGGDRDELYCGEGTDDYAADKNDYVSGDCEVKVQMGRM